MIVEPDPWLKSIFSYYVFRVSDFGQEKNNLQKLNSTIKSLKKAFLYTKIPVGQEKKLHAALNLGFQIVDINVTLERKPEPLEKNKGSSLIIREADQKELQIVSDIAGVCFTRSRFHQDPEISQELANTIKRRWVENYFRGERGECILVAEISGKPAGFLAIVNVRDQENVYRVIDLIGVHPQYQGKGIGTDMVNFFIDNSVSKCDRLRVGTQIINIASLHLYEKSGFCISGSSYVLHAHVNDGEVLI